MSRIDPAVAAKDVDVRICMSLGLSIAQTAQVLGISERVAKILRNQTRRTRIARMRAASKTRQPKRPRVAERGMQ